MSNPNIKYSTLDSRYAQTSGLSTVAMSGSYSDLSNKPTITTATASDVPFSPTGTIAATTVQTAIAEAASEAVQKTVLGTPNGVATLDSTGQVPLSQLGNAPSGGGGGSTTVTANPSPAMYGLITWVDNPVSATANFTPVPGTIYLNRMAWPSTATATNIVFNIVTGVASLVSCYVGLYNASGMLLGVSSDQSSSWATAGLKTIPLTSAVSITGSASTYVYFALLVGNGSATPTNLTSRIGNGIGISIINFGLSTASSRAATSGTSQTTLPSSITMSGITQYNYLSLVGVN